jgi:hypothetical protein
MWLQIFGRNVIFSIFKVEVKMEGACFSEKSVTIYNTTRYYNPEGKTVKKILKKSESNKRIDLETLVSSYY